MALALPAASAPPISVATVITTPGSPRVATAIAASVTPSSSTDAGRLCHGISLILTDRERLDAPEMGVEIASALARLYPQNWDSSAMPALAGSAEVVAAIRSGEDPRRIEQDWQAGLDEFKALREPYLLYR